MYHCCGFGFRQPWCHKWKKDSRLKLIPVQHHFLIISCSYALNPAPAPTPARFAKKKTNPVYSSDTYRTCDNIWLNVHYCVLFSNTVRLRIRVRTRSFSVRLVSCYADPIVLLWVVIRHTADHFACCSMQRRSRSRRNSETNWTPTRKFACW